MIVNELAEMKRHVIRLFNQSGLKGMPRSRLAGYEPNPETVTLAEVTVRLNHHRIPRLRSLEVPHPGIELPHHVDGDWHHIHCNRLNQHAVIILKHDPNR